jgi:hypothetical protein
MNCRIFKNSAKGHMPQRNKSRVLDKYLYTHIHSSTIYNRQGVKVTQVFIGGVMDNNSVVYTYNGNLKRKEVLLHATT